MNYKKIMQKIMTELTQYKGEIDKFTAGYQEERKRFNEEMEAAKGKFTDSYIQECYANWKPKLDFAGLINMSRERHAKNVEKYISQLEQQLNNYFRTPADANFCATITAIASIGNLTNREFSLLQGASGGYWGLRLLHELGISRTKTEQRGVLERV